MRNVLIVTGASSGIGRAFAQMTCEAADEVWLIARREARLRTLAAMLPVPAKILPLDLTRSESFVRIRALVRAEKPRVVGLVNASGFGKFDHTADLPLQTQTAMIDLNVRALTAMCAVVMPYLCPGAAMFNMGSLSAFQPLPYFNVYAATKAYVLRYSQALNAELRPRGVRVIAVCPSWVDTAFFKTAESRFVSVKTTPRVTPQAVVAHALRDLLRGRDVSIWGASRAKSLLGKILPGWASMGIWQRTVKA